MSIDELIAEAGRRIAEEAPGARVIVFGSHARGEAGNRSDVDLLVVEPEVENAGAESVRLRRALRGLPAAIDVVVVSEGYADAWRDVRGSLVHAAMSEGAPRRKLMAGQDDLASPVARSTSTATSSRCGPTS